MNSPLLCPICRKALSRAGASLVCPDRHRFDLASEGYVNLAVGKSGSGDSPVMCRARRDFLSAGYYRSAAEALADLLSPLPRGARVLDAGCGEGYYLRALRQKCPDLALIGLDLAKTSIRLAARAERGRPDPIEYAVSGIFSLPLPDRSCDAVLSVFAPIPDAEAARVLKPGGLLLAVHPGKVHLNGLKARLYDVPYSNEEKSPPLRGFSLASVTRRRYTVRIASKDLPALFAMTPYYWRTTREDAARLTGEALDTDLDFLFSTYRLTSCDPV